MVVSVLGGEKGSWMGFVKGGWGWDGCADLG